MNPRITNVTYQTPYKLLLTFADSEVKEFDFSSYLQYPVYQVLIDEVYCAKAKVLNGTVVWDNDVDFDPDTLYIDGKMVSKMSAPK